MLVGSIILISVTIISLVMTYILMKRNKTLKKRVIALKSRTLSTEMVIGKLIGFMEEKGIEEEELKILFDTNECE